MADAGTKTTPVPGQPPRLTHDELGRAQSQISEAPRRRYGIAARVLFASLDVIYGKPRTLSKFKILELIARVPYQAWEQVAYVAITHVHERTGMARRIHERIRRARPPGRERGQDERAPVPLTQISLIQCSMKSAMSGFTVSGASSWRK